MNFPKLFLMIALSVSLNNDACGMKYDEIKRKLEVDHSIGKKNKKSKKNFSEDLTNQLFNAVKNNDIELIKSLLNVDKNEYCADVNALENVCWTPLHWALQKDYEKCVKLLLDHGAHINAKDNIGRTPLHRAPRFDHAKGDEKYVKFLLNHGADVSAKDYYGHTPLHLAAYDDSSVQLLLDHMKVLVNKISSEQQVEYFAKNKEFNQQFLTYLLCIKRNQKKTHLKVQKYINFKILSFICCLNNLVNMKNNEGETAFDLTQSNKAKKVIETFKKENNIN